MLHYYYYNYYIVAENVAVDIKCNWCCNIKSYNVYLKKQNKFAKKQIVCRS